MKKLCCIIHPCFKCLYCETVMCRDCSVGNRTAANILKLKCSEKEGTRMSDGHYLDAKVLD